MLHLSAPLSLFPLSSGFQAGAFGDTRSLCHRVSEVNFRAEDFSGLVDELSNFIRMDNMVPPVWPKILIEGVSYFQS